jgi:hypothetical protein
VYWSGRANLHDSAARMISWSPQEGKGQPRYTDIVENAIGINVQYVSQSLNIVISLNALFRLLRSAIVFKSYKQFSNLSRVDPARVSIGHNGAKHFHLPGVPTPIVFMSVIVVATSDLLEPKLYANSKPSKGISGALVGGEWERFVGTIGMVLHEREFKGQLFKDHLSFSTAPLSAECKCFKCNRLFGLLIVHLLASGQSSNRSMYKGSPSPFTHRPGSGFQKVTLSSTDTSEWPPYLSFIDSI